MLNDVNEAVVFRSAALTGATTQQVIFKNTAVGAGSVLVQTDTSTPTAQLVAPDQTVDNVSASRLRADATGAHMIYHGDLNGPTGTDLYIAFDDAVVAQEGAPLPGGYFPGFNVALLSGDSGSQQISPYNGHFAFRGNINDGSLSTATDFVILDGAMVAATDRPIRAGSAENYVDSTTFTTTFFINAVNSCGDIVIGGTTDAADENANAVLVLNGKIEVLREGAPVDLNGNGLADDNVAIHVFNNDDSFLTDDRKYYFHADLRDPAAPTVAIGQALLWIQLPPLGDVDCSGVVDFLDIDPFLLALFDAAGYDAAFPDCDRFQADANCDDMVDFFDIDPFLAILF